MTVWEGISLSVKNGQCGRMGGWRLRPAAITLGLITALGPTGQVLAEETVAGTINGLRCVTDGVKCPVDADDPLIETLADFVLQADGEDYFYLDNVGVKVKESLVLETVRVTGEPHL